MRGIRLTAVHVLVLLHLVYIETSAQTQIDFASSLMKDQDYFRAISVYKEVMYFSDDINVKNFCLLQTAIAYHRSNKFKESIRFFSRLLNQPQLSDDSSTRAQIYLGLNYCRLRLYPIAEQYFQEAIPKDSTGFASYYLSLAKLEQGKWHEASRLYGELSQTYPDRPIGQISRELSTTALEGSHLRHRAPYLSAGLSLVIPGSGQFYCHHYYDGLQALTYVGAFAFASFNTYRYNENAHNNHLTTYISVSIAGLFYLGNIFGAHKTASYYNLRQKEDFLNSIRGKILSIDF